MVAFQEALGELEEADIAVVAASTDPLEKAEGTVREQGLTFPVGYGLPLRETAATLGAYFEERRGILHATGFLVRPDRTISVALYSSGPIGRLVPEDVVRLVRFYRKQST